MQTTQGSDSFKRFYAESKLKVFAPPEFDKAKFIMSNAIYISLEIFKRVLQGNVKKNLRGAAQRTPQRHRTMDRIFCHMFSLEVETICQNTCRKVQVYCAPFCTVSHSKLL